MKKAVRSFVTFNRTEHMGVIVLCSLLLVLLLARTGLSYMTNRDTPYPQEAALEKEWANAQPKTAPSQQHETGIAEPSATAAPETIHKAYQDANDEQTSPLPDVINVNTADSATLVRLKGIGPATAHKVMEYRRGGDVFTDLEDFRKLLRMPHKTYEMLLPHLTLHGKGR